MLSKAFAGPFVSLSHSVYCLRFETLSYVYSNQQDTLSRLSWKTVERVIKYSDSGFQISLEVLIIRIFVIDI